ncbi:MAG: hypothetical protein EYC70_01490 [Planctomycetota bacterium]|nr:MAG: hypothetical protein EYC70_01490 [Planctomycetota bacterium]
MATCCVYEYLNPTTGAVETWYACKAAGGKCRRKGANFRLLQSFPVAQCPDCKPSGGSAAASASLCRRRIREAQEALETWTALLEEGAIHTERSTAGARKKARTR